MKHQNNTKVRLKTFDNQSLKFDRIEVSNNKFFGIKKNSGDRSIVLIEKDNIEKIQVKDKSASMILTITYPLIVVTAILLIVSSNIDYANGGLDQFS